jgi:hypothetical protein
MKNKAALDAVEFAKQLQKEGIKDGDIKKLCKMAGVKLYLNVDVTRPGRITLGRTRRTKDPDRKYFTPPEVAKMTGRSRSTITKIFKNDPGVRKQTFAGPGRRKVTTLLISREALKRRFPDLNI